ncbi:MAG: hypothetical protein H0T71_12000 [Acidobacteria bacterium]|nr:hypothetical protein [Acidobacteriota bacterium]
MDRLTAYEDRSSEKLAVGLGWLSIALGLAELAAPRRVARLVGIMPDDTTVAVLRSYGARSIGNGFAILAQPDQATWLWSRVAGDALDFAALTGAMNSPATHRSRAICATVAVLGVTALDVLCARRLRQEEQNRFGMGDRHAASSHRTRGSARAVRVAEAVTINAPLERVQERWANLESMPSSLRNLTANQPDAPGGASIEFRAAPAGRGTQVHVGFEYTPTGGALGGVVAKMFSQDPAGQLRHDLRCFKQLMETGEITLSDGPALWRPAQPAAETRDVRWAAGVEV